MSKRSSRKIGVAIRQRFGLQAERIEAMNTLQPISAGELIIARQVHETGEATAAARRRSAR